MSSTRKVSKQYIILFVRGKSFFVVLLSKNRTAKKYGVVQLGERCQVPLRKCVARARAWKRITRRKKIEFLMRPTTREMRQFKDV